MATVGSMLMMFKQHVAEQGMYAVLERLHEIGIGAVEVSQVPMDERNVADLERAGTELGMQVGAISVALRPGPVATGDNLEEHFDKVVADARRLDCHYARIGMMPFTAMAGKEACEQWAAECEQAAQRLAAEGITLCYHNHHVALAKFDGERIFDLVRRVAPSLNFEVDLHWVQRGGMNPIDMLRQYRGVCRIIHVKDFRVVPLPPEAMDLIAEGRHDEFMQAFTSIAQFAEVGQGNMNWPELLPAAVDAGAEWLFIEQDETYGRDPFDCVRESRQYLAGIGW